MKKLLIAWQACFVFLCCAVVTASCGGSANDTRIRDSGRDAITDTAVRDVAPENTSCDRPVLTQEVTNARDLGGWPLASGKSAACRRIMRGGTLAGLGDKGCDEFAALGIRTVVDVREAAVQQSSPPPDCVTKSATLVSAPMPKILPDTPENYLAPFDQGDAVRAVFGALDKAESYPVYIHCEIGRDRTNFIVALILLALGADRQTIVQEFELSSAAGVAVKTECIDAVVDEVEKRGGIKAVLDAFGVSETAVEVLRAQMVVE
jgi:protein-tyrosine phosphatase